MTAVAPEDLRTRREQAEDELASAEQALGRAGLDASAAQQKTAQGRVHDARLSLDAITAAERELAQRAEAAQREREEADEAALRCAGLRWRAEFLRRQATVTQLRADLHAAEEAALAMDKAPDVPERHISHVRNPVQPIAAAAVIDALGPDVGGQVPHKAGRRPTSREISAARKGSQSNAPFTVFVSSLSPAEANLAADKLDAFAARNDRDESPR